MPQFPLCGMANDADDGVIDSWEDADAEVTGRFVEYDDVFVTLLIQFNSVHLLE